MKIPQSEKIPYTPPENKRFEVSRDPITQERISVIRDLQSKFSEEFGIDVGVALFGSIVKGKEISDESVAEKTDIDFEMFLDADQILEQYDKICEKYPEIKTYEKGMGLEGKVDDSSKCSSFRWFLKNTYIKEFLKKDNRISPEILSVDIILLSEKLVTDMEIQRKDILKEGLYGLFFGDDGIPDMAKIFHLDVGGFLPKYRKLFMEALSKVEKTEREEIWERLRWEIVHFERKSKETQIDFPVTFEEAYGKYVNSA